MMLKFVCYFPAETPIFSIINIGSDVWVTELVDAIVAKFKGLGANIDVAHRRPRLFKTDIPTNPSETLRSRSIAWLQQQQLESSLTEMEMVSDVFPDGPTPGEYLGIIIANAEVLDYLGDYDEVYKRKVKKALDQRINRLISIPSPLEIIHSPKEQAELLDCNEPVIHMGRPGGVPAANFSPILAALQRRLDHLEGLQVSRVDVERAARYAHCVVKYYDDEKIRERTIKDIIDEAIGVKGEWDVTIPWANGIRPNGSWWCESVIKFIFLILEHKSILGPAGDATLQAALDYAKIVSQEKYKSVREHCNFPIVLVGVSANRLDISIAICIGSIYVSHLLSFDVTLGFHSSANIERLARVFAALSLCRVELQNYYNVVGDLTSPRLSCLFPSPTLIDSDKTLPKLVYRKFLSRAGQPISDIPDLGVVNTTMYIATTDEDEEVIVKFTSRYNKDAHILLADAGLAPKLLFCELVVGDLYMVVMDRVPGKSIWQLKQEKEKIPSTVLTKVTEAVCLLHEHDIVFGDLRLPNILYNASGSKDIVVLVDFDWAGLDGVSRYPATLNPSNLWDEGVLPYGIMLKKHDLWQLKQLTDLCAKLA